MFMVTNLNTENGLSSSRVYSIVEAEDGAMWISTKRGVDRYNGQVVTNYTLATEMQYSDASGRTMIVIVKYMPMTIRERYIYIIRIKMLLS